MRSEIQLLISRILLHATLRKHSVAESTVTRRGFEVRVRVAWR